MAERPIDLSGGLVDSVDPLRAPDGSLSRADDMFYNPADSAPTKMLGRTKFNTGAESAIKGVVFIDTITNNKEILILSGTTIRKAAVGKTGAFVDLFTGLSASPVRLDAAHLDRHVIITNGVDRMRIYGADFPTGSTVGFPENATAPVIARDTGIEVGFTLTLNKKIRYWFEERVKDAAGNILKRSVPQSPPTTESTAGGGVAELTGDGSLDKPRIAPISFDSETTDWALYATSTDGKFPNGAEIKEVPVATLFIDDTRTGTNPSLPSGALYQQVSLVFQGVSSNTPRNGAAPIARTLAVLDDQIVSDDVDDDERIRWSFPGEPHKWPANFFARPGSGTLRGRVLDVRSVGDVFIIACDTKMVRALTLPQTVDDAFSPERLIDDITGAQGILGREAGDVFLYKGRELYAYASPEGIIGTDGDLWIDLGADLDYKSRVNVAQGSKFIVQNDPQNYLFIFAYVPKGGTNVTEALLFHYHPTKIKGDGRLTITGPVPWGGNASAQVLVSGENRVFTGRDDGFLYLENEGITRADGVVFSDGAAFNFVLENVERRFAGLEKTAEWQKVYVHHSAGVEGQVLAAEITAARRGAPEYSQSFGDLDLTLREAARIGMQVTADTHKLRVINKDSLGSFRVNAFSVVFEDGGQA